MVTTLVVVAFLAGAAGASIVQRTFAPNDNITRAEAITMIHRAMGEPEHNTDVTEVFSDVPPDAFYSDAVAWAWENQITFGKGVQTSRDCYPQYNWEGVSNQAEREANECIVYDVAVKWGIDPGHFGSTAYCESKFLSAEKNPKSSATGVMQFVTGTWEWITSMEGVPCPDGDRTNPVHNVENAAFLWTLRPGGGTHHWVCA